MWPALLVHLYADYICQSSWMALNKTKRAWPCLVHVLIYTACFLLLTTSWKALLVIGVTHYFIDRYSLAKYLIYAKERLLNPKGWRATWKASKLTGYYDQTCGYEEWDDTEKLRPLWITVWLYIITDNTLHLTINYFALKYL